MHPGLRSLGRVGKGDCQRCMQVLSGAACRSEILRFKLPAKATRAAAPTAEHTAQEFFKSRSAASASEPLSATGARASEAVRTEAETFELSAATRMKSAAARLCTEPFESLKTRLAFGVDLAAVIRL